MFSRLSANPNHIFRLGRQCLSSSNSYAFSYIYVPSTIRTGRFTTPIRSLVMVNTKQSKPFSHNHPPGNSRSPFSSSHGKSPIEEASKLSSNSIHHSSFHKRLLTILRNFLAHKEMPPRYTFQWYREMLLICTVFGITGTSTMILVRPAVSEILGIQGSLKDGPWSYRICSIVIMTPIYSFLLVIVGTVFGRHAYFRHFAVKMFSRFGIPPDQIDSNFTKNAEKFRKW
jgi:hypothetical protein